MKQYDDMKYVTVPIESDRRMGTGFFAAFSIAGQYVPVLVTAAHVVCESPEVTLILRYQPNETHIATASISCTPNWIWHEKDICCCPFADIDARFQQLVGYPVYRKAIGEDKILAPEERANVGVLSEIVMLGYPNGILNCPNMYPLYCKGYLSSLPSENEGNGNYGYADIIAVSGSSGSPMLLMGENSHLMGILTSTVATEQECGAQLAKYVDACCLLELKREMEESITKRFH